MPVVEFPSEETHGYCVKCHSKVPMTSPETFTNRRGVHMVRSRCSTCSSMVHRFIGKVKSTAEQVPKRKAKVPKTPKVPVPA